MLTWPMSFQQGPMEWDESTDSCHVFDMKALSAFNYPSPLTDECSSVSPAQSQSSPPTGQPHESPEEKTFTMLDEGNHLIPLSLTFNQLQQG